MKTPSNLRRLLLVGAASIALAACSDTDISSPGSPIISPPPPPPPPPPPTVVVTDLVPDGFDASSPNIAVVQIEVNGETLEVAQVSGTIESDLTFEAGVGYYVDSQVFIGNDAGQAGATGTGVTATFLPGATVYGSGPDSGIIVSRGSDIIADGTAASPIVFTSLNELQRSNGTLPANANARSEWVGLTINGFAPINNCNDDAATNGAAGCEDDGEASSGVYGGGDPTDNSGILDYVRVEFAGVFFNEEDQSNGIAFQGVGSGTQVTNIQVHNNGDDGVEFFGGTVAANNVVITGAADDSIDWTDGWTGSMQRVLVLQSSDAGDFAIEADNRSTTAPDEQPRSFPRLSNFTFVGNGATRGMRFREGTAVLLVNGVIADFTTPLLFGDEDTASLLVNGPSPVDGAFTTIASHLISGGDAPGDVGAITGAQILGATQDVIIPTPLASSDFVPGPERGIVPVFDVSNETGLSNFGYVGAFAPEETVDDNWAADWTRPGSVFPDVSAVAECPTSAAPGDYTITQDGRLGDKIVCAVSGVVTQDLTLGNGSEIIYRLDGQVFVGEDGGPAATNTAGTNQAILTVAAGVTVFGDTSTDGLVITRGSQIIADGTAANPIVFTSGPAVRGQNNYATANAQWLGLSINGKAPINKCDITDFVVNGETVCQDDGEASSGVFGGNVSDDNSGILDYVRVEFAGIFFNEEDQSNGIAFQGVGSDTEINFIQVHNNGDDGIEFFGGTANAKNVVITGAGDDAVDWTDGWQGNIQYLIVEQKDGDDYGFEGDNRSETAPATQPRSIPQISNFTILSSVTSDGLGGFVRNNGARFREGMGGAFVNGIMADHAFGIDVDQAPTTPAGEGSFDLMGAASPTDGATLTVASILIDSPVPFKDDTGPDPDDETFTAADVQARTTNVDTVANTLVDSSFSFYGRTDVGVVPGLNEAGVTPFDPTTLDSDFFDAAFYAGAVENASDTWYLGWTVDSTGNVTSAD